MQISKTIIAFLFPIVIGILPSVASAHATPISYTPEAGATELTVPSLITITFTERIELNASSITVFGPSGEEVGKKAVVDDGDGRSYSVSIQDDGEGVYTISWQVVSVDDGHFTKGANSFLVDTTGKEFEGSSGGVQVTYVTRPSEAVFNFLGLLGESIFLAVLFGLIFVLKPLFRKRQENDSDWSVITKRLLRVSIVGFLLLLVRNIATIVRKTSELAALQEQAFMDILPIYLASSVGFAIVLKTLIASFFVLILYVFQRKIFTACRITFFELILLILIFGILYLQSKVSHAAASHFLPDLSIWITVLHLFAKELIIGGALIMCVLIGLNPVRSLVEKWTNIVFRYDRATAILILIAGTTGVYVTWLHLKEFEHLFDTDWGRRFIALLIVTVLLGVSRLVHQFILHPLLSRSVTATRWYRITLPIEVCLGLVILFLSGYISVTTPPFTVEQTSYQQTVITDGVLVTLDTHSYEKKSFRVSLVNVQNESPLDTTELIVLAHNSAKGIGPNVLKVEERFVGGYVFAQKDLSPLGTWDVAIVAKRSSGYDVHAQFEMNYPDDVIATQYSDTTRAYDSFAKSLTLVALLICIFSSALFTHAYFNSRKITVHTLDTTPFTKQSLFASFSIACLILFIAFVSYKIVVTSDFERTCLENNFEWKQALPTRDFENVSPNSTLGCTIHGGHFHFIDQREFEHYLDSITESN